MRRMMVQAHVCLPSIWVTNLEYLVHVRYYQDLEPDECTTDKTRKNDDNLPTTLPTSNEYITN